VDVLKYVRSFSYWICKNVLLYKVTQSMEENPKCGAKMLM
jgi:hypothetical protein